jgi:hypothetical protein
MEGSMGMYQEVYDFAAKAGALEGYVYPKKEVDLSYLPKWVDHIVDQYRSLPPDVRDDFQRLCDGTLGRAIQSLLPYLGEDHEVIKKLRSILSGRLPSSLDDFQYGR